MVASTPGGSQGERGAVACTGRATVRLVAPGQERDLGRVVLRPK
ncbi:MAG TPA: hypothetical protein VFI25_07665 [Planctomycetota bacterium]|nr:hypothetical protein [Planctomycetota bacterium]